MSRQNTKRKRSVVYRKNVLQTTPSLHTSTQFFTGFPAKILTTKRRVVSIDKRLWHEKSVVASSWRVNRKMSGQKTKSRGCREVLIVNKRKIVSLVKVPCQ